MYQPVSTRPRPPEAEEGFHQRAKRSSGGVGAIGPSTPPSPCIKAACWHSGPRSPGGSSGSDADVDSPSSASAGRVLKVPDVALPMQHSLLKRISGFQTKDELLEFVAHYHMLLDPINLVTCLYRLAKMSKEASRGRSGFLAELQRHPTFQLLLRSISSKFLQGHLNFLHTHSEGLKGVDGRCLANLTWALAKLDLSSDDSALTTELALTVAPFIVRTLGTSSPQGLANMLWSYAKLPVAPPAVVSALVGKIADLLVLQNQRPDGASTFDAQALSNSVWALAHLKSRGMDVDGLRAAGVMRFLSELAGAAARALVRPHATLPPPGSLGEPRLGEAQRYLALVEREFSCQALVNIAWSFATLLGVGCTQQAAIHHLFGLIRNESLTRLRCTALALGSGQSLPYVGGGGFNEQALSNVVYAFDKVGMLSSELLSAVFEVSALRLQRGGPSHHMDLASFKPQELCTLLKACHANIAPPWAFLGSLLSLLSVHPAMADTWTAAERLELHRACQLYLVHQAEAAAAGHQAQGPAVSAAMGLASSIAASVNVSGGGRASATGSSLGPPTPPTMLPGGGGGSGPPSGSFGVLLAGAAGQPPMRAGSPRTSGTSGAAFAASTPPLSGDPLISTFGQLPMPPPPAAAPGPQRLPSSAAMLAAGLGMQQQQQQQQQQAAAVAQLQAAQRARAQSATGGPPSPDFLVMQMLLQQQQQRQLAQQAGVDTVSCPVCGAALRQHEALAHVEACIASSRAAAVAGAEALIRQQQQQQAAAAAAARWAVMQAQNQQMQQSLYAAQQQQLAAHAQQQQQQQQQQQAGAGSGLLGLDDYCRAAGAVDAVNLASWMVEAAAASRPPLQPARRF